MIPYGRQNIGDDDIDAVTRVLRSDFLTQGPEVAAFEAALTSYTGARYAVAVNSGTAALHIAYVAADLQPGDEVIVPPNTFVATTNMLLAIGAKPVFVDIRLDTYNIDESKLEAAVTSKTRAVVAVDFAGHPAEYDILQSFAKNHSLILIADASHALGGSYNGQRVGTLADMTVLSFHPVKQITTGEGGAVLTDSELYYRKLLSLRSHGIHKNEEGTNVMTELGYNYRLPDVLAALGTSQMTKLDRFLSRRREVASLYQRELATVEAVVVPAEAFGIASGWHLFVIRTTDPADRVPLRDYLRTNDIGVNFHYPAVYAHPYYHQHGFAQVSLPQTELYQASCITLPCHTLLTDDEVVHVCNMIKQWFHEHKG